MLRRVGWRQSTDFPEDPTVSIIRVDLLYWRRQPIPVKHR